MRPLKNPWVDFLCARHSKTFAVCFLQIIIALGQLLQKPNQRLKVNLIIKYNYYFNEHLMNKAKQISTNLLHYWLFKCKYWLLEKKKIVMSWFSGKRMQLSAVMIELLLTSQTATILINSWRLLYNYVQITLASRFIKKFRVNWIMQLQSCIRCGTEILGIVKIKIEYKIVLEPNPNLQLKTTNNCRYSRKLERSLAPSGQFCKKNNSIDLQIIIGFVWSDVVSDLK